MLHLLGTISTRLSFCKEYSGAKIKSGAEGLQKAGGLLCSFARDWQAKTKCVSVPISSPSALVWCPQSTTLAKGQWPAVPVTARISLGHAVRHVRGKQPRSCCATPARGRYLELEGVAVPRRPRVPVPHEPVVHVLLGEGAGRGRRSAIGQELPWVCGAVCRDQQHHIACETENEWPGAKGNRGLGTDS